MGIVHLIYLLHKSRLSTVMHSITLHKKLKTSEKLQIGIWHHLTADKNTKYHATS